MVVIGKTAKNVSEADALSYVYGYTAANDISSRVSQLNQSQWCFSKSFDTACPIGKHDTVYSSLESDQRQVQQSSARASCQIRANYTFEEFSMGMSSKIVEQTT